MEIANTSLSPQQVKLWSNLYERCSPLWDRGLAWPTRNSMRSWMDEPIPLHKRFTGQFRMVPVFGKLDDTDFFEMLSMSMFPVNARLRPSTAAGYLSERDLWHDCCHIPFLQDEVFASFLRGLGVLWMMTLNHPKKGTIQQAIERVYWATAEFGLLQKHDQIGEGLFYIQGAGIASSPEEMTHVLDEVTAVVDGKDQHKLRPFALVDVFHWDYPTEGFQDRYYFLPAHMRYVDILKELWTLI